jgi:WD40 repeat protein
MHTYRLLITLTSLVTAYTMTMQNNNRDSAQRNLSVIKAMQRQYIGTHGWTIDTGDQSIEKIKIVREFADYQNTQFLLPQNNKHKYIISNDNDAHIINMQTGAKEATFAGHTDLVLCCAKIDYRNTIATGSHDTTIKLWDTKDRQCLQTLHNHETDVTHIASQGDILSSTDSSPCLKLWAIEYGQCTQKIPFNTMSLIDINNKPHTPMSLIMNNHNIVVGFNTGRITIMKPCAKKAICDWYAHKGSSVNCLMPCKSDRYVLYSGSCDQTIKQWDLRKMEAPTKTIHQNNNPDNVYEDQKGKKIFSSDMRTVYIWDISSNEPKLMTKKRFDCDIRPNCMQMNDDETELYIGTTEGIKTLTPALDFNQLEALVEQK